jgi:hypothetical protein
MKQRQRTGLVTPQQNNGNALPLPSPQPLGLSMQQQQQQGSSMGGLTPAQHHRTLSQSSNIQPPVPQPPQQQQQQGQPNSQNAKAKTAQENQYELSLMVQTWTEEHLIKATIAMVERTIASTNVSLVHIATWKEADNQPLQAQQARATLMQMIAEHKRRYINPSPAIVKGLEQM